MAIESRKNRTIKDIRRLKRSKGAEAVLEGPHLVAEACRDGLTLETVLATRDFLAGDEGRGLLPHLRRPPLEIEPAVLAELCDADSPRGVLAVTRLARAGPDSLPLVADGIYLFLDGVQDPGNLGAVVRALEAAGGTAAALSPGCAHPNHPRALRGSAGSLLRVPVAVQATAEALGAHLTPVAPRRLALMPRGGSDPFRTDLGGPLVLAIGAEGPGLSGAAGKRADQHVTIPLDGRVESLNLAVAAALVLFEARRQRRSS